MDEKALPIAEIFTEIQGEGMYAGTIMTFIRTAGCTVGRRFPKNFYEGIYTVLPDGQKMPLPMYTEQCTLYDGRTFACDTDYRKHQTMTPSQIATQVPPDVEHVCITGGEPCMHELRDLIRVMHANGKHVHLETSGTIDSPDIRLCDWVTVSPKKGVLLEVVRHYAHEVKLLVDENFDWSTVPDFCKNHQHVYLQPVNGENTINVENLRRVRAIQKDNPHVGLSLQLHKVLESILKERVR